MKDLWENKYARPVRSSPNYGRAIFHHVNPNAPGRAHCNRQTHLMLETEISDPPDDQLCRQCMRRAKSYLRPHMENIKAAVVELASKLGSPSVINEIDVTIAELTRLRHRAKG